MLREITTVKRKVGNLTRRWFSDESIDLFVFFDKADEMIQIQLSYDKLNNEHILCWKKDVGFSHDRVDDGQDVSGKARAPIMVENGAFDIDNILLQFKDASDGANIELFNTVYDKLIEFKLKN